MKFCISTATTLPSSFTEDVTGFADAGVSAMEVWLTKLEQHLEKSTVSETQGLLEERGVSIVAASSQGGLLSENPEKRRISLEHFKRRLELCQTFKIPTLVLVADYAGEFNSASLDHVLKYLTEAARWAEGFGVRLALEFDGNSKFCSCVETAMMLIAQCSEPNLGLCLDAFQFFKGPSKTEDLDRITGSSLTHVQLCDVAGMPRELMSDKDRIFPGEGNFYLQPIYRSLKKINYDGYVSLELMNPNLWHSKVSQIAELGYTALNRELG